jgi:uncharacterized protein (TIGR02246 family)
MSCSCFFCVMLLMPGVFQTTAAAGRSVLTVTQRFSEAWQNADAHALAELFAPDATLVVPDGLLLAGRPAIESFYRFALDNGYAGTHVETSLEHTTVRREMTIVDGQWRITGIKPDDHDERGIFCSIVVRDGHQWSIVALREQSGAAGIRVVKP